MTRSSAAREPRRLMQATLGDLADAMGVPVWVASGVEMGRGELTLSRDGWTWRASAAGYQPEFAAGRYGCPAEVVRPSVETVAAGDVQAFAERFSK